MLRKVLDSYLLEVPNNPKEQTQVACSASFPISFHVSNNDSAIMLWHYRLGHPNFLYLKKLFLDLLNNTNAKFLQCEICQLSKDARTNLPIQGYKVSHPFALIRSDIGVHLESITSQELHGLYHLLMIKLEQVGFTL